MVMAVDWHPMGLGFESCCKQILLMKEKFCAWNHIYTYGIYINLLSYRAENVLC
jgi:hypothetical protein